MACDKCTVFFPTQVSQINLYIYLRIYIFIRGDLRLRLAILFVLEDETPLVSAPIHHLAFFFN